MSSRRQRTETNEAAERLRSELHALKEQAAQVESVVSPAVSSKTAFDQLSGTEQAAGSLGVHPEAWKPIRFMNNAHYKQLIESNSLDDTLARRIEAFRCISGSA